MKIMKHKSIIMLIAVTLGFQGTLPLRADLLSDWGNLAGASVLIDRALQDCVRAFEMGHGDGFREPFADSVTKPADELHAALGSPPCF